MTAPANHLSKRAFIKYALILVLGVFIGAFFNGSSFKQQNNSRGNTSSLALREPDETGYTLTSPLLECGEMEPNSEADVIAARREVEGYIAEQRNQGAVSAASVYYRDLNNGPWFGIDEKTVFMPGSLLKVPLLMSFFKKSLSDPKIFDEQLIFNGGSANAPQHFPPAQKIMPGQTYKISSLLEYMIRYSDNDAALILDQLIDDETKSETYRELGVDTPTDNNYQISVRRYATFFRILYNSTYLPRNLSEAALDLLTETNFNDGLVAGVPKNTIVAHKFGERELENQNAKQLHDCGIIYAPKKPYTLCVMTRGNDMNQLPKIIAKISEIVYRHTIK